MSNWSNIDFTFLYDGTFEGFLTLVFHVFETKQVPLFVFDSNLYIPNITVKTFYISTDLRKSTRVFNGILNLSDLTLYYTNNVFLSGNVNKDVILLKYLISAFKFGANINNMLTIDEVLKVQKISKTVTYEIQRLKGFVRFTDIRKQLTFFSNRTRQ